MSQILKTHILKFIKLTDFDLDEILSYFKIISPLKKENLVLEGEPCKYNYFVEEGCLRMFFIDQKGVEKTVQFALEHWWLTDYFSFQNQNISQFSIQAVEKSKVWAIDFQSQEKMLSDFPQMERYFRLVHQTAHAAMQVKTKYHGSFSREELYRHFNDNFPEFSQRIPQYLLASYLNITPEYLSELRAKHIS